MKNLHNIKGTGITRVKGTLWGEDAFGGVFTIDRDTGFLRVIASNGDGWDHLSVSLENRTPHWEEMEYVKRLFFKPQETAMQLHVAETQHLSVHPFTLHIWRPHNLSIPLPPRELV